MNWNLIYKNLWIWSGNAINVSSNTSVKVWHFSVRAIISIFENLRGWFCSWKQISSQRGKNSINRSDWMVIQPRTCRREVERRSYGLIFIEISCKAVSVSSIAVLIPFVLENCISVLCTSCFSLNFQIRGEFSKGRRFAFERITFNIFLRQILIF